MSDNIIDINELGKKKDKRTPYMMTNEANASSAFGEITLEEDGDGGLWLKFIKGNFQIWISPKAKKFALIKGLD